MIWKKINNTESEVSNKGLVRNIKTKIQNRIYTRALGLQVYIKSNEKVIQKMVHILVAEYFLENFDISKEIIHINGNIFDNRIENLKCQKRTCRNKVKIINKKRYKKRKNGKSPNLIWIEKLIKKEKENTNKLFKN